MMRTLFKLIKWDTILLFRYSILPVAIGIGALYTVLIHFLKLPDSVVAILIFSDPSMIGFIFVGVMVLFEKQADTTSALVVTPLLPWQYLLSKSITLSIPAIIVSIAMAIASQSRVNYPLLLASVVLTSILFLLLGFVGAMRVRTFNQYILIIPMFLAPLCLPLVSYLGFWETPFMWVVPTHSSLVLLKASFEEPMYGEVLLSVAILLVSILFAWKWALVEYKKRMIGR